MSAAEATSLAPAQTRRACVIGAGIGGLALAIRLQGAGVQVTLVEARDRVGGCAAGEERDGFQFDCGPTMVADPGNLRALWALTDHDLADDIELLPVSPACRYHWPDGTHFDLGGDMVALRNEIARIDPVDMAGMEDFLRLSSGSESGRIVSQRPPRPDLRQVFELGSAMLREGQWRSALALAGRYLETPKLCEAMTVHLLMEGANPVRGGSARMIGAHDAELYDLWHPRGGVHQLTKAMARHFERLGGTIRMHDPVVKLHLLGNRITEVEASSGWREHFDAVANNGDTMHFYRDLLPADCPRGRQMARRLAKRAYSPGMFVVHFVLEGGWPGIPHRMVLFGPRYEELLRDIFDHGVLPQDFAIFLTHPSVTDHTLVPEGRSLFQAAIPVAHMGKLALDWEQVGPLLEKRVLDEIGRRLVPDIHDRVVTRFHRTPRDHALDMNAYLGSAFGEEPLLAQSGWLRPHLRDDKLANAYLVGAGTHPGAGVGNVLSSARLAAGLMMKDLGV